jgi:hypothetical protein
LNASLWNLMKITKEQLNKIHDLTKYHYRNDVNGFLSPDQLVSAAWVKSTLSVLFPNLDIKFPERKSLESPFSDE